jgi:5-methylcytosine-specific restriction endonuclease McrA
MSQSRRLRIWEAHSGICCLCEQKIDGTRDKWIVEHKRALGLGGADDDANCAPAHETCRRLKDRQDVPAIAKAKRMKARHVGAKGPSRWRKPSGVRFDWRQGRYVKEARDGE